MRLEELVVTAASRGEIMSTSTPSTTRLRGRPERVFISVDESTGRSTISFQPVGVADPVQREGDRTGAMALREATTISETYPGCTIHGPHFHTARPPGRSRPRRKGAP
jgi:hypothetical protein